MTIDPAERGKALEEYLLSDKPGPSDGSEMTELYFHRMVSRPESVDDRQDLPDNNTKGTLMPAEDMPIGPDSNEPVPDATGRQADYVPPELGRVQPGTPLHDLRDQLVDAAAGQIASRAVESGALDRELESIAGHAETTKPEPKAIEHFGKIMSIIFPWRR